MAQERTGVATLKGNPLTLIGPELKKGDKAPDFQLNKSLVDIVSLSDFAGKVKLSALFHPSIQAYVMRKHVVSTKKLQPGRECCRTNSQR